MDVNPLASWAVDLARTAIDVRGPGATAFLQGLISNDIGRARDGALAYSFLLTPQGKYLFEFFLEKIADGYRLDVTTPDAPGLSARLRQYKLRAKVEIESRPDLAVFGLSQTAPTLGALADPRVTAMGARLTLDVATAHQRLADAGFAIVAHEIYEARRIGLGVPDHHDFVREQSFLLECNGEELHGVDFRKGCYVGQELTARMKHRGTARRRILRVIGEGASRGAAILDGERDIGTVLSVSGGAGLGLVRLDRWREAGERPLTAGGSPIEIAMPAYHLFLPPEEAVS